MRRGVESRFSSAWREEETKRGPHCCFYLPDVGSVRKYSHVFFARSTAKE